MSTLKGLLLIMVMNVSILNHTSLAMAWGKRTSVSVAAQFKRCALTIFYIFVQPRFVTHIDDAAIAALTK